MMGAARLYENHEILIKTAFMGGNSRVMGVPKHLLRHEAENLKFT